MWFGNSLWETVVLKLETAACCVALLCWQIATQLALWTRTRIKPDHLFSTSLGLLLSSQSYSLSSLFLALYSSSSLQPHTHYHLHFPFPLTPPLLLFPRNYKTNVPSNAQSCSSSSSLTSLHSLPFSLSTTNLLHKLTPSSSTLNLYKPSSSYSHSHHYSYYCFVFWSSHHTLIFIPKFDSAQCGWKGTSTSLCACVLGVVMLAHQCTSTERRAWLFLVCKNQDRKIT